MLLKQTGRIFKNTDQKSFRTDLSPRNLGFLNQWLLHFLRTPEADSDLLNIIPGSSYNAKLVNSGCFKTSSLNSIVGANSRVNVSNFDIEFYIYINSLPASNLYVLGGFTDPNSNTPTGGDYDGLSISIDNTGKLSISTFQSFTVGPTKSCASNKTAAVSVGNLYKIRITQTLPNASVLYINDTLTAWTSTTNTLTGSLFNTPMPCINRYVCYNNTAGTYNLQAINNTNFTLFQVKVTLNTSDGFFYPLASGYGSTCYDVSGNGNHGTVTGSTPWSSQNTYHYNIMNGFEYYSDISGNIIRVPYLLSGGQITPVIAGFTKRNNHPAGSWHNFAESWIDMDPGDTGATALDVWNKSNAAVWDSAVRSSIYYDSSNPYYWHASELNVAFYAAHTLPAYARRLYNRIILSGSYTTQIKDILNFNAQLTTGKDALVKNWLQTYE